MNDVHVQKNPALLLLLHFDTGHFISATIWMFLLKRFPSNEDIFCKKKIKKYFDLALLLLLKK